MTTVDAEHTETLRSYLSGLYEAAGFPSLRKVSEQTGVSHTTVSDVIQGRRRSRWPNVAIIVTYLGGDVAHARRLVGDGVFPPTSGQRATTQELLAEACDLLRDIRDRLPRPEVEP